MTHFALLYEAVDDFIERRGVYREEHLRRARSRTRRMAHSSFFWPTTQVLLKHSPETILT
jgi:hypothetical protein